MSKIFASSVSASSVGSSVPPVQVMPQLAVFLGRVVDACLWFAVFLIPFVFSTLTIDVIELNKQTLLVLLTCVAVMAWIGKAFAEKRFSLSQSWLHGAVLFFGMGYLLVSLFSEDKYLSFVGVLGQMPWSFTTIASLILFYLVAANHLRSVTQIYNLIFGFLASSFIVGLVGIFQLFGWYWFPSLVTHSRGFSTVGSVFSLAVYLAVPLVIASALTYHGCRDRVCVLGSPSLSGTLARLIVWATMLVSLALLVMVDFWVAWAELLFGTVLMVVIGYIRSRTVKRPVELAIPAAVVLIAVFLLLFKTPLAPAGLPAEVAPSATASWMIARETLQKSPLYGSGPGTWIYEYAKFRAPAINQSPFWNVRFDRAFSAVLTLLATTGLVGAALWLILLASAVIKSATHLLRERNDDVWFTYLIVFTGWATLAFASFFYNFNMAHQFAFWFLLALLGNLVTRQLLVWDGRRSRSAFAWLGIVLVLITVGGISAAWTTGQRYVADVKFSKAVELYRSGQPLDQVVSLLERARSLNPWLDIYPRNLSQAHLLRVNALMQGKPTPEQFTQVHAEVKTAVDLGIAARDLAPANVDDWANLALLYQSVASFTRGADEYAIKSFQEASMREPQNPVFVTEIGKLYILRSEAYRTLLDSRDAAAREDARKQVEDNLKQAAENLRHAVALKSDYFPAHYHLGVVYERQGKLREAIGELEEFLRSNNRDAGVAFELAILYYRNNEKERALNLLEQIVAAEPTQGNARWYLASMYEERGALDSAVQQLEELSRQIGGNAMVEQRLAALRQAIARRSAPAVQPLPEPLPENVNGPSEQNPLKR